MREKPTKPASIAYYAEGDSLVPAGVFRYGILIGVDNESSETKEGKFSGEVKVIAIGDSTDLLAALVGAITGVANVLKRHPFEVIHEIVKLFNATSSTVETEMFTTYDEKGEH